MRCDLHVHTIHSGMCTVPIARRFCRESYNQPEEVYESLKRRGMQLVTITDHDSIDAGESLLSYPDFFQSVEVTAVMPSGAEAHIAVYGLSERQHFEIQRRRKDLVRLLGYLAEQRLPFAINHIFSGLTGRRHLEDFGWFEKRFGLVETVNSAMSAACNENARRFAAQHGKAAVAGSDAHTLRSLGSAWTEVRQARTREDYLAGLRLGHTRVHGRSSGSFHFTLDVLTIVGELMREKIWTVALAPLVAALPLVILLHHARESAFARHWFRRLAQGHSDGGAVAHWPGRGGEGAAA